MSFNNYLFYRKDQERADFEAAMKVYREEEYSKRFGERTRRSRGGAPSTPKSPPLQKTTAAPPPRGVSPARTSRQRPALRRKTITGVTPRKPAKRNRHMGINSIFRFLLFESLKV